MKPNQPTVTEKPVSAGSSVTVSCQTTGCRPAAYIFWKYKGSKYNGHTRLTSNETTETFTIVSEFTRQVAAEDNGRNIECIVTHIALVSPPELKTSINIDVQCKLIVD